MCFIRTPPKFKMKPQVDIFHKNSLSPNPPSLRFSPFTLWQQADMETNSKLADIACWAYCLYSFKCFSVESLEVYICGFFEKSQSLVMNNSPPEKKGMEPPCKNGWISIDVAPFP